MLIYVTDSYTDNLLCLYKTSIIIPKLLNIQQTCKPYNNTIQTLIFIMQSSQKRNEFTISIRRKQISQKMQTLRSQYQLQTYGENQYHKYLSIVDDIKNGKKFIKDCLKQLKILSYWKDGAIAVGGIVEGLYAMLIQNSDEIETRSNDTISQPTSMNTEDTNSNSQSDDPTKIPDQSNTSRQAPRSLANSSYSQILSILLNLCIHIECTIPSKAIQQITLSILNPDRQIISLWYIGNIIYQKSIFSQQLAHQLIYTCEVLTWLEKRVQGKFKEEGDAVILFYFCVAFLGVGVKGGQNSQQNVGHLHKRIFRVILRLLEFQAKTEENWWLLGQGLVDYGWYIAQGEYCFFQSELNSHYLQCCKQKKTQQTRPYLKMLLNFSKSDPQPYTSFLKYNIFNTLLYCLQNRFPQIKTICAQIGTSIINGKQGIMVDIENIGFFNNLALELLMLEKYGVEGQIGMLRFGRAYFGVVCRGGKKERNGKGDGEIDDVVKSGLIGVVGRVVVGVGIGAGCVEIVGEGLDLLQIFLKIDQQQKISNTLHSTPLPQHLHHILQYQNPLSSNNSTSKQIQNFLTGIEKQNNHHNNCNKQYDMI